MKNLILTMLALMICAIGTAQLKQRRIDTDSIGSNKKTKTVFLATAGIEINAGLKIKGLTLTEGKDTSLVIHNGTVYKQILTEGSGVNYWTKIGNDIQNNNDGNAILKGEVFVPDITATGTKFKGIVAGIGEDDRLFPKSIIDLYNEQIDSISKMKTPPEKATFTRDESGRIYLVRETDLVGLGTSTPSHTLEVNGTTLFHEALGFMDHNGKAIIEYDGARFMSNHNGNLALGTESANFTNEGILNIAIGDSALRNSVNAYNNLAIGVETLKANTTGINNISIGNFSSIFNTEGTENTVIGIAALGENTLGQWNICVGNGTLSRNIEGHHNAVIGGDAMNSNRHGYHNVAIGDNALISDTNAIFNVVIGSQAGSGGIDLERNIFIGHLAGHNLTTGKNNIIIGDSAEASATTKSDELNIGGLIKGNLKSDSKEMTIDGKVYLPALTSGTGTRSVFWNDATGELQQSAAGIKNPGYMIPIFTGALSSPADATTYYIGSIAALAPSTTAGERKIYIPVAGTIKFCQMSTNSATAGSNENWSYYIRVNDSQDYLIETIASNTSLRTWKNISLNITVAAGDFLEIKTTTPSWTTNPVTLTQGGYIYIEQ